MIVLILLLVSWLSGWGACSSLVAGFGPLCLACDVRVPGDRSFNKMKHDLARMIPAYLPRPLVLVYMTGVLELLGATGLMLPPDRACVREVLGTSRPPQMHHKRNLHRSPQPERRWRFAAKCDALLCRIYIGDEHPDEEGNQAQARKLAKCGSINRPRRKIS